MLEQLFHGHVQIVLLKTPFCIVNFIILLICVLFTSAIGNANIKDDIQCKGIGIYYTFMTRKSPPILFSSIHLLASYIQL